VLIVDDHPFVRLGVGLLLAQADGIAVVGECTDGTEVLDAASVVDLLTVVEPADDAVIGVADGPGVGMPRPVGPGGALVGAVTTWSDR